MIVDPPIVRAVAREVAAAANSVMEEFGLGRAPEETQITGQLVGAIRERLQNRKTGSVRWTAYQLRASSGRSAEERRHGADLLGVLDISIDGFAVRKGFLAQAKIAEPGVPFKGGRWNKLVGQCMTMLDRTPDSFVLAYSKTEGIRLFPATAVIGLNSRDLFELYGRRISSFFESFIECFVGDHRLHSADIATLDALPDFAVEHVLKLEARSAE